MISYNVIRRWFACYENPDKRTLRQRRKIDMWPHMDMVSGKNKDEMGECILHSPIIKKEQKDEKEISPKTMDVEL